MLSDLVTSLIRTATPVAVAIVAGFLASIGLPLTGDGKTALTGLLMFAAGGIYYLVVRALEARWPWLGVLLGVPRAPTYVSHATPVEPPRR